jgi:hypothetical protein
VSALSPERDHAATRTRPAELGGQLGQVAVYLDSFKHRRYREQVHILIVDPVEQDPIQEDLT